jgi:hypothetical protein
MFSSYPTDLEIEVKDRLNTNINSIRFFISWEKEPIFSQLSKIGL